MKQVVDKKYENWTIADLAEAPVSALSGVSESDARKLYEAFNIKTIRDLGTNKYFRWAQAIVTLAEPAQQQSRPYEVDRASVSVYLDIYDESAARSVLRAVNVLADYLGYGAPEGYEEGWGSFLAKWNAKIKAGLSSQEVRERLVKVERALELAHLDKAQADVDAKEAEAFAQLVKALSEVPSACVRVGSLLVVKFQDGRGEPFVFCRTLSQLELRVLEKYPEIQKKPAEVLTKLAMAVASETPEQLLDPNDRS